MGTLHVLFRLIILELEGENCLPQVGLALLPGPSITREVQRPLRRRSVSQEPPPSLSFLLLRHYCLPREHEELKSSQPLSFRNSRAHPRKWSVAQSMGSDHQKPVWRVVLICVSGMAFLAWCALRRKTDIDRLLEDAMEEDSPEEDSQTPPSEQGKPKFEGPAPIPHAAFPEPAVGRSSEAQAKS
uniref:Protein CCSMST1 n=1 Tax=Podarcis muralis TaxID=64176 RepID=A0A670KGI6_PODMU